MVAQAAFITAVFKALLQWNITMPAVSYLGDKGMLEWRLFSGLNTKLREHFRRISDKCNIAKTDGLQFDIFGYFASDDSALILPQANRRAGRANAFSCLLG